jgi:hypothetical protein
VDANNGGPKIVAGAGDEIDGGASDGLSGDNGVPQLRQNLASGRLSEPHLGQPEIRPAPQASQKTASSLFSLPQLVQNTLTGPPGQLLRFRSVLDWDTA